MKKNMFDILLKNGRLLKYGSNLIEFSDILRVLNILSIGN